VLTALRSQVPLRLRETCDGLTVVASAFGPLGGDRTQLHVTVGPDARLAVGSAAAQVAQPGVRDAVSHAAVRLRVGAGADLRWQLEPLVVTAGAEHRSTVDVDADPSATVVVAETAVLGRTAGRPGRYRSSWRVRCGGRPLLSCDLDVGQGAPDGWDGPAVVGGARVLVTALVTGPALPPEGAQVDGGEALRLAGPGVLLTWLGHDPVAGARALASFLGTAPGTAPTA
jgi:urease accessory protein